LDEDQPGSKVLYKKLFEEDREYNQGSLSPSSFSSSSATSSSSFAASFHFLLLRCKLPVTILQLFDQLCNPPPPLFFLSACLFWPSSLTHQEPLFLPVLAVILLLFLTRD